MTPWDEYWGILIQVCIPVVLIAAGFLLLAWFYKNYLE